MKRRTLSVALSILAVTASGLMAEEPSHNHNDMADCPMKAEHAAGVDDRGDKGMGFSHTKTTHHFRMMNDGGAIEVTVNDASDLPSRDQIRGHLAHIAKLFGQGNFDIPMFVHDTMPAGAVVMQQMKSKIAYAYEEMETGGRVRITASDPKALSAIHDFLRFQIQEHRTGDKQTVD